MRSAMLALVLALAAGSAPLRAQEPAPAAEAQAPAPVDASQALRTQVQSLPAQAGPPRSRRAYGHLIAAYAFACLALFGYGVSLSRRFRRLQQQMDPRG